MNFISKIKQMSNLKKFLLVGGIVVVALFLALCVQKPEEVTTPPPTITSIQTRQCEITMCKEMEFRKILKNPLGVRENQSINIVGRYNKLGSYIDVAILKNNKSKWWRFFLDKDLSKIENMDFVKVSGKILTTDYYGYPLIKVNNWERITIERNKDISELCKQEIERCKEEITSISLLNIVTKHREYIHNYKLKETDFLTSKAELAFVDFENEKAIYLFKGEQIPAPQLVKRWVSIYCVYDTNEQRVEKLILTVEGEVYE